MYRDITDKFIYMCVFGFKQRKFRQLLSLESCLAENTFFKVTVRKIPEYLTLSHCSSPRERTLRIYRCEVLRLSPQDSMHLAQKALEGHFQRPTKQKFILFQVYLMP